MGIYHFSGLFVLLCIGLSGSLLTSLGEHVFYHLVLPRIKRKKKFNYWLHTSQVGVANPPTAPLLLPHPLFIPGPSPLVNPRTITPWLIPPSHSSLVPHRKSTVL